MTKEPTLKHHGKTEALGPAWAEINLAAVRRNYLSLRTIARQQGRLAASSLRAGGLTTPPELLPVIKSEAYGHGMVEVAKTLARMKVRYLAVSDVREGVELRRQGLHIPVLLFESTWPNDIPDIVNHQLTPCVGTATFAAALNRYAASRHRRIKVHLAVDTGMSRLGVPWKSAGQLGRQILGLKYLELEGLMTHFPLADRDPAFTRQQVRQLSGLTEELSRQGARLRYVHAANSLGLAGYSDAVFNLARPGLMLYGLYPHPRLKAKVTLVPVMEVKTRVLMVKLLPRGCGVSYGHTFVAPRDMTVAVLAIGYSNGYSRLLSNRGRVLVNGTRCPVVGNVTMDQIMVDVSRAGRVRVGQTAVILGRQKGEEISADELADLTGTINYEIVCSLGSRLLRVYKK